VKTTIQPIRKGDFFEVSGDQAEAVAKTLRLTLTTDRDGNPMVGWPYYGHVRYVRDLTVAGFEVVADPPKRWCTWCPSRRPEGGYEVIAIDLDGAVSTFWYQDRDSAVKFARDLIDQGYDGD